MMPVAIMIAVLAANAFYLFVKIWEDVAHRRWLIAAVGLASLIGMNGIIAISVYLSLMGSTDL